MSAEDLEIKQLTLENIWLKKQIENLTEENKSIYNEYLNYMEYSELTILDLAVELNKLKGIDNTMSTSEFQALFNECKLNELDYYSS